MMKNSLKITYKGKTKTISEWAKLSNKPYNVLVRRYYAGWNAKKIIETPASVQKKLTKEKCEPSIKDQLEGKDHVPNVFKGMTKEGIEILKNNNTNAFLKFKGKIRQE